MYRQFAYQLAFVVTLLRCCQGEGTLTSMPKPTGWYSVGWTTTEFVNSALTQPFAPDTESRRMELSIFYPVTGQSYITVSYMPPEIALTEDVEHSVVYGLNAPDGTFEKLGLKVAPTGSHIASSQNNSTWPVLVFSPASGTTRLFYSYLLSNIASYGYVVVAFDTPYDTDVVQFSNGDIVFLNSSIQAETACNGVTDVNLRAQDEGFIIDQLENKTLLSSLIPGCDDCLNLNSVGAFGHSVGGATAATALGSDKRIASGLNYDGVLWGDVITQNISKPYMIMAQTDQTITNTGDGTESSWAAMWVRLTGEKYFAILNDSLHYTYSDLPLAFQTLNLNPNDTVLKLEQITGLDPVLSTHIISEYTLAFFNQSLGGMQSDLLKGPSPLYPEITFDDGASIPANTTAPEFLCSHPAVSSPAANGT